ncbi:acyl-CoA dehydrogenase family protein [Streptomyces mirabilis]
MAWDFSTEPEFEKKLEWIRRFRAERVDPLDLVYPDRVFHPLDEETGPIVRALKQQVRDQGLWAPHLGPELGGRGFGQLKLALINEILGESSWAPVIFGTAAPDTGNAEIIARYGTEEQKERYLKPLLEGECFSCFSMTEPQAGADPKMFTTRAVRDDGGTSRSSGAESGGDWVITGRKFFSSNARTSKFVIVMAVTDPDVSAYRGMSMFLVPSDTPGIRMERHLGLMSEAPDEGMHALIEYDGVRVPGDALLGGEGQAFAIAQTRLGGGRVHHAMRVVGQCQKALDMMAERALSRETQGGRLADKQLVQADLADSYAQLQQFRLFVLHTAWQIDRYQDYKRVRKDISAIKFLTPKVLHDIVYRSMHLHGALGVSNEMPFADMWTGAAVMAVVDGPSEIHKVTVAKDLLRGYEAASGPWPSQHLPARREWARKQLENM